jgi:hypothetical protein
MAEDAAELETRPAEPERNEEPDFARRNDDQSGPKDGESKDRKVQEADKFSAPLPRWPFVLVGLIVAIFAAVVLYIIFRPRPDVRTDDAFLRATQLRVHRCIPRSLVRVAEPSPTLGRVLKCGTRSDESESCRSVGIACNTTKSAIASTSSSASVGIVVGRGTDMSTATATTDRSAG